MSSLIIRIARHVKARYPDNIPLNGALSRLRALHFLYPAPRF